MKIYFDTCCYGRPYDDQAQDDIRAEAEAVMNAVDMCRIVGHVIVGSMAVGFEIGKIRDADKRAAIEDFFNETVDEYFVMTANEAARAAELQAQGVGVLDSHHLAAAEAAGADILLTTDAKFMKVVTNKNLSKVNIVNPLNFFSEALK
jgi:predicted nucleic acid-binding protein